MERDHFEEDSYLEAKKRVKKIKGFYWHLFWYIVVNGYLLVNVLFGLGNDLDAVFQFHNFSTPFYWGIGLAFHWFGVFGKRSIFSKEWEERKIKELMDKDTRDD